MERLESNESMNTCAAPLRGTGWHTSSLRRKTIMAGFWVLAILNVALPKGGVKAGDVPLTFGYMALAAFGAFAVVALVRRPLTMNLQLLQFGAFFLPVALLVVTKMVAYDMSVTVTLIYLTQFMVLPIIVLLLLSPFLEEMPADVIGGTLVLCIRFTILWGLLNFVLFAVFRNTLEIPYITVNAADYGEIFDKNNMRGSLMKLVSTYNNGNLYGVCMVMMAPVYLLFERSRIWATLLFAALICTLSRTVWFATATVVAMMVLTGQIEARRSRLWLSLCAIMMAAVILLPIIGWSPDDVELGNLGGRVRSFSTFELTLFGRSVVSIPELVYFGFLNSFGVVGFVFAVGCLAMGPIYALLHYPSLSPLRRAAFCGATSYLAAALIDGAFVFPPTMVHFLFITGLIYRRGLLPDPGPERVARLVSAEILGRRVRHGS